MSAEPQRDRRPRHLCLDVDGVLTTGGMYYTADGKVMKRFGPDDHDALRMLQPHLNIHCITGDKRGYPISRVRVVDDMNLPLTLVSPFDRAAWIDQTLGLDRTIYMADGLFDGDVFPRVFYAIAPADAFPRTRARAHFVTACEGGKRAVAEAVLHILDRFFPGVMEA